VAKPDYSDRIDESVGRVPYEYRETSNPAAVGWTWTSDGREFSLVWSRDETPLMYSIRGSDGKWTHMSARHPRMSGISTLKAARDVAEWFINGHMLPENDSAYE